MYYILYSKNNHSIICISKDRYYLNKVIKKEKMEYRSYLILEIYESDLLEIATISR